MMAEGYAQAHANVAILRKSKQYTHHTNGFRQLQPTHQLYQLRNRLLPSIPIQMFRRLAQDNGRPHCPLARLPQRHHRDYKMPTPDPRRQAENLSQRPPSELAEDLTLIEEIEDFALEDMAKLLYYMY